MTTYNEQTRPRIIMIGCDKSHPVAKAVTQYAGTVSYRPWHELRPSEWDGIVAVSPPKMDFHGDFKHVRSIQFGGSPLGAVNRSSSSVYTSTWPRMSSTNGVELHIPPDLNPSIKRLVKDDLLPALLAKEPPRSVVEEQPDLAIDESGWTPFMTDGDKNALAASYRSSSKLAECWWLPNLELDHVSWIEMAFECWSETAPDRFPSKPNWTTDQKWMTSSELAHLTALEEAEAAAELARSTNEAIVQKARDELSAAREVADNTSRRLLTETGDPLVEAVANALRTLGFDVTDMDTDRRAKVEDLRIKDGDWEAIVEVKGYTSGGKPSDISKIERFSGLYAMERKRLPDAKWYVVNQFRERSPESRQELMRNHAEDVQVFSEGGGVIVDTRVIFTLLGAVERGELTRETVLKTMKAAVGRLEHSSATTGTNDLYGTHS